MLGYGTSSSQKVCRMSAVSWFSGPCALGAKEGSVAAGSGSRVGITLDNLYCVGVHCGADREVAMALGTAGLRFCNLGSRHGNLSKYSQLSMYQLSSTMDTIV